MTQLENNSHWFEPLRCPLCSQPLKPLKSDEEKSPLACDNGHQFDWGKPGYFHLLPVHQMKSKAPGDSKEMVKARTDFLQRGFYQPIAEQTIKALKTSLKDSEGSNWLDAGCGEGYYSALIQQAFPNANGIGLDISKAAIQAAAKHSKALKWLVASSAHSPFQDDTMDAIVSMYSRLMPVDFHRVLKQQGRLITVNAGPNHLQELKALLYDQPNPYRFDSESILNPYFIKVDDLSLAFTIELDNQQDIQNLLLMTPHYWRAKPQRKEQLRNYTQLSLTVDARIECFQRNTLSG